MCRASQTTPISRNAKAKRKIPFDWRPSPCLYSGLVAIAANHTHGVGVDRNERARSARTHSVSRAHPLDGCWPRLRRRSAFGGLASLFLALNAQGGNHAVQPHREDPKGPSVCRGARSDRNSRVFLRVPRGSRYLPRELPIWAMDLYLQFLPAMGRLQPHHGYAARARSRGAPGCSPTRTGGGELAPHKNERSQ